MEAIRPAITCGWRDLYADCTPRDYRTCRAALAADGPLEATSSPDNGARAPRPAWWEMQRWFDRMAARRRHRCGGRGAGARLRAGAARAGAAEADWLGPPSGHTLALHADGSLAPGTGDRRRARTGTTRPSAWPRWPGTRRTTALDRPYRPRRADDARALCFTGALAGRPGTAGHAEAQLELQASALPLNLVLKLSAVAANGASTLMISTGWMRLDAAALAPGPHAAVALARHHQLAAVRRASACFAVPSCADFPRLWPTPGGRHPAVVPWRHLGPSRSIRRPEKTGLGTAARSQPRLPPTTWARRLGAHTRDH